MHTLNLCISCPGPIQHTPDIRSGVPPDCAMYAALWRWRWLDTAWPQSPVDNWKAPRRLRGMHTSRRSTGAQWPRTDHCPASSQLLVSSCCRSSDRRRKTVGWCAQTRHVTESLSLKFAGKRRQGWENLWPPYPYFRPGKFGVKMRKRNVRSSKWQGDWKFRSAFAFCIRRFHR